MRRVARPRALGVIALLVAVVLVVAGVLVYRRAAAIWENLGPILVRTLQERLGREVVIGSIQFPRRGLVVLEEVAVAHGERLAEGALATAERIEIRYDLWHWTRARGDVIGSIREVLIVSPWLLIERDPEGRLNLQQLFPPRPDAPPTTFRGRILARDGAARVRDDSAHVAPLPAVNEITGLEAWAEFAAFPRLTFGASGSVGGERAGAVNSDGYLEAGGGPWFVSVRVADAAAAYWVRYFFEQPPVDIREGRADVALTAWRGGAAASYPTRTAAVLQSRDLTVRVPGLRQPVREISGRMQWDGTGLSLNVTGRLAGMPLAAEGRIIGFQRPVLAIQARAPSVTLAQLRQAAPIDLPEGLPVLGPASVTAQITGPLDNPSAQGALQLASITAADRTVRGITAGWRLRGGVLYLTEARAEGVRLLETRGWVDFRARPARLYAVGRIEGLPLAEWTPEGPRQIGGVARGRFALGGAADRLNGQIGFEVTPLRVGTTQLARATGQIRLRQGLIEVRRLSVVDPAAALLVSGTITPRGELNLTARASGVSLEAIVGPQVEQPVGGTAFFWGAITGTTRRPRLTGNLQLYAARWDTTRVDFLEGRITATPDTVSTERLVARLYPASLIVRGSVHGLGAPTQPLDLTVEVEELSLAQVLLALDRKETVAGTVAGRLAIGGTLARPLVSGSVEATGVGARGYAIGALSAQLRLTPEALLIEEFRGQDEGFSVTGEARVVRRFPEPPRRGLGLTAASPVQASLTVRNLDLALLNREVAPYTRLEGELRQAQFTVGGTLGSPEVTGRVQGERLVVNGEPFDAFSAVLTWTEGQVSVPEAVLVSDGGRLLLTDARWRPRPAEGPAPAPVLEATARAVEFSLARLIALARASPFLATPEGQQAALAVARVPETITGRLSADLTVVQAAADRPVRVDAAGTIATLIFPEIRVDPVVAAAAPGAEGVAAEPEPLVVDVATRLAYETGRLELTALQVTRDDANLTAEGTIILRGGRTAAGQVAPEGSIELQVDAVSIPMRPFGRLLPVLYPADGVGDLHVDIEGSFASPRIEASADVDNPVLAGVTFTRLSFPRVELEEGRLQIESARLTRTHEGREHPVTLDGTLPFRWRPIGIPRNAPRSLTVRVPRQSVEMFADLVEVPGSASPIGRAVSALAELQGLTGQMEANITLAGTALQPENSGDLRLYDVGFGIARAETRVRGLNVHLAFVGDTVSVQQFHGFSSAGGSFEVLGEVVLGLTAGREEALDLALHLRDVRVRERNLSGVLNERIDGTFRTVSRTDPSQALPLRITGEFLEPVLEGAILTRNTTLTLPAAFPPPEEPLTLPPINPRFDMVLLLGSDTWLANPNVRLQLIGRLPVTGTLAAPQVRGTLAVERGTMTFPTVRFNVSGEILVAYAPALADDLTAPIRVDLEAVARMRSRSPVTGVLETYTITLVARGPLAPAPLDPREAPFAPPGALDPARFGQLTIEASADPPLSQRQILAMLGRLDVLEEVLAGTVNLEDVLRHEVGQALTTSVVPALFLPFEMAVAEALGLEEFALDVAFREPVQLRLGKQLYGNLWASYVHSLTGAQEAYRLDLYYRFSPRLRIGYRIEEPFRQRSVFLNGTFRF